MLHILTIPSEHDMVCTESDLLADCCTASNIWENIASMPIAAGGEDTLLLMAWSTGLLRLKACAKADIVVVVVVVDNSSIVTTQ
jgi:hypothetical protein